MRINMKKVSVGIDIGGTNTSFGIVDESVHIPEHTHPLIPGELGLLKQQ